MIIFPSIGLYSF